MQTKNFFIFLNIKFLHIFSAYTYFFRDQSDYANNIALVNTHSSIIWLFQQESILNQICIR